MVPSEEQSACSAYTFGAKDAPAHQPRPHSSGFRTFLNWFKRVESSRKVVQSQREPTPPPEDSDNDSSGSETSTATASSFAFLPASGYRPYGDALAPSKYIASGPYTETYRKRVADHERRRRLDSGVTLRKKYQLHGADATLTPVREAHSPDCEPVEYDTFSLPAMSKRPESSKPEHRRAASESKFVRPVSYVHVKGKRRAPPPPTHAARARPLSATLTRRVKRMAPQPPVASAPPINPASPDQLRVSDLLSERKQPTISTYEPILFPSSSHTSFTQVSATSVVVNCGPLPTTVDIRPTAPPVPAGEIAQEHKLLETKASPSMSKKPILFHSKSEESWKPLSSAAKQNGELSPRPWYKRQFSENKTKTKANEEHKPRRPELPEIGLFRYSKIFESKKATSPKGEHKRFSGLHALPNISELDREAAEILQMHKKTALEENNNVGETGFANPRSARLLITKFNELNKCKVNGNFRSRSDAVKPNALNELLKETVTPLKTIPDDGKLKSGDDTWVCMRCEKRNNGKKIICSQCFSKKPKDDEIFPKNIKEDMLQSFESEVLDALKHLGDMSKNESLNNKSVQAGSDISVSKETAQVGGYKNEEKQKLREILREMKNSLPKQHKNTADVEETEKTNAAVEPSTSFANDLLDKTLTPPRESRIAQLNAVVAKESKTSNLPLSCTSKAETKLSKTIEYKNQIDTREQKVINVPTVSNEVVTANNENSLYANLPPPQPKGAIVASPDVENPKLLLKELQAAISKGDDQSAADIAKKLAQMKVSCTVISSTATLVPQSSNGDVTVDVYIEDAESAAGPVRLRVSRDVTVPQLRAAVRQQLDIPVHLQRWIVGKNLCVDDAPLAAYNGGDFTEPLFLYLVSPAKSESDVKTEAKVAPVPVSVVNNETPVKTNTAQDPQKPSVSSARTNVAIAENSASNSSQSSTAAVPSSSNGEDPKWKSADHYQQLVQLENQDVIPNSEPFTCIVCLEACVADAGVVLRECLHAFCRSCLRDTVRHCDTAAVVCPYRDSEYSCNSTLQEREVRSLVSEEDYEKHLAKSVQLAETNMKGTFHCKTADCRGWCVYEHTVNMFRCPICRRTNCLTCQVIHEGENCAQYQERIRREADGSGESRADAERTRQMLEEMCSKGDALVCPSCQVVLMKKWGCDWVRCSVCRTEICWVTRGARWGPGGKGDISAGCRCGVDGVKCHPSCSYCH